MLSWTGGLKPAVGAFHPEGICAMRCEFWREFWSSETSPPHTLLFFSIRHEGLKV